jgi:glycosyltransferase involved in cell wall biosynthesis
MREPNAIRKARLAYVVSHPIQYQANLLRRLALDPGIDLHVFFCSDFSASAYQDKGFGVSVAWDVPLLTGYNYTVLPRWRETHSPSVTRPISRGFFRGLRRGINGQPFDLVWVHGYSTVNTAHAMLAAKALGLPVLTRSDSWLGDRSRAGWKLQAKQIFFGGLKKLVDGVLAVGTRNAEYWRHYMGDDFPIFRMPYAVDNEYFAGLTEQATLRRAELQSELGLDPERPVILYASKLQKRKHCDHLLEAYLQLRATSSLAPYLLIVGDGEMRADLEQHAQTSDFAADIRFVGFRNQSELPRFFDLSSVFVLPARHEPWGLIVNEAMAASLPVIVSSDVGAADDLVHQGENGYVYPVGDIPALCAALEQTLAPGRSQSMGQVSRRMLHMWSFEEDITALRHAISHLTRLRLATGGED